MSRTLTIPPPGFDDLSIDEKIDYVLALWERLAAHPEQVPVPEWHRSILGERLREQQARPEDGKTWDEVREGIEQELRDRRR